MADPVNTVLPVISGTTTSGLTLSVNRGSWTLNPTFFAYQWKRETAPSSGVYSAISGATGTTYRLTSADVGRRIEADVSATVPDASPGLPDRTLTAWNALLPGLTTTTVTTVPQWISAAGGFSAGQLIDVVSPITISVIDIRKHLSSLGAIRFCPGVVVQNSCYLDASNIAIFGGELSGARYVSGSYSGSGLTLSNCTNIRWWGVDINNTAAHGLFIHSNVGPNSGLDIAADISVCGRDLTRDPHAEKGTGLHPCYIGSGDAVNVGTSGKFVLVAHDCDTGGMQFGNNLHNTEMWIDARRLNKVALSQVAGNAMQWWSKSGVPQVQNVVVHWCYGEDLAGRMSETDGLPSSGPSNIVVEVARHGGTIRLSPIYDPHPAINYVDCT